MSCGGSGECCTCHCFLTEVVCKCSDYTEPDEKELDALDFCDGVTDESRLACQTKICKGFDKQTLRLFEMD